QGSLRTSRQCGRPQDGQGCTPRCRGPRGDSRRGDSGRDCGRTRRSHWLIGFFSRFSFAFLPCSYLMLLSTFPPFFVLSCLSTAVVLRFCQKQEVASSLFPVSLPSVVHLA